MSDIINAIKETPIPLLLILTGIIFLLLGLSGGISGKINIPKNSRRLTIVIGTTILILGLVIHFIPNEPKPTYKLAVTLDRPEINRRNVKINGLVSRTDNQPMTGKLKWNWGDGQTENHWFPADHEFATSGKFIIVVKAIDVNDIEAMDSVTVNIE